MLGKSLITAAVGAGGADSYWIATLGGASSDTGQAVAVDAAKNIYVCGLNQSQTAGGQAAPTIAKYDASGVIQWQRRLGGAAFETFYGVAIDSSANVYACGSISSQGAGANDVLIAKYSSAGSLQWQRSLGGSNADNGYGIAVDSSDNIYVCGTNFAQALICKYNSSGTIQWQRGLDGASSDQFNGIALDSSNNVYVCGTTNSQGAGDRDLLLAKYNSSGTIQWQRLLGGSGDDRGNSVAVDASGNVYVCGTTDSQGAGGNDGLIAKYNSSGTLQWQRSLGGASTDQCGSIAVDGAGDIYICGITVSGYGRMLIAKYDSTGSLQWQRRLGGSSSSNSFGNGITIDASGNVGICGYTNAQGAGDDDFLIAKLPPDGSLTGTYGSLVYESVSLTDSARTLTAATSTLSDSVISLTDAARTLTDAATTLTSTTTDL